MKIAGRSRYVLLILLVLILSALPARLAGAAPVTADPIPPNTSLRFESLSIEQGLSQSVVNVTFQDNQGFLWFGTQDGLNRYDGYHFTIFRPDPDDPNSLSDRMIMDLAEDSLGRLWIGTMLGGLNRYNPQSGSFTHYLHDVTNPDSLGGNCIRTLFVTQDGLLWIGSDGGVDILDPRTGTFQAHYRHDENDPSTLLSNAIIDILQDSAGITWIASEAGLSYQLQPGRSFRHFIHEPADPGSLMASKVNAIAEDHQGDIWLGTEVGIERLDHQALTFEHFFASPSKPGKLSGYSVKAILEDYASNIWVATTDGLNLLDRQSSTFTTYRNKPGDPSSLGYTLILSLYQDREGILWIGTYGGGVSKLDRSHNKFPILQYDPADPKNISSFGLIEDHTGQLWFTLYGTGLLRVDRLTGEYTLYKHDPDDPNSLIDNFVWTVNESRDGTIWVGGNQGLNALDPMTGQFTHYQNNNDNPQDPYSIHAITAGYTLEDSQGKIWIGTPTGLECLDRSTGTFTLYQHDPADPTSLSKPSVSYIFESQSGDIWLGMSEGGLSKLDQATGRFTHYQNDPNNPQSISSNDVLAIMQGRDGTMWLGTTEGLNQFDPQTGKALHYTVKDGLPNDVIYGIVEDDQGYLWLSTNYGLSRFDPRTGEAHNYDFNDGLQSDEFNTYAFTKTRQGEIIFAGISGVNIFRPDEIQDNTYIPPVVLTRLTQGGTNINVDRSSTIPHATLQWPYNFFEFEFAALSYSNPAKNQYAYYLEKFDQDWVDSGAYNYGRYTNLPGGSYTLHIKGANSDGIWNETGTALEINVVPPFWQAWWFRIGAAVLALGAAFAVYRLRVRSIEGYNRDLKRQVEERTHEIETLFEKTKELAIVEERNRLARDLHDSAKQKAFAALAQLGAVRSKMTHQSEQARSHLDEVEDLVYEVIQELTFLIQEMYPMALKEKGLITILREYLFEWESRNNIHVDLSVGQEHRLPLEIEQALYRIAQEALANIARHSHATQVNLELGYNGENVGMSIEDNGAGFNLNQKPAGVGLRTMGERATMIGGSLDISSVPGKGTRVHVLVPLPKEEPGNSNMVNGGNHEPPNHHPDRG